MVACQCAPSPAHPPNPSLHSLLSGFRQSNDANNISAVCSASGTRCLSQRLLFPVFFKATGTKSSPGFFFLLFFSFLDWEKPELLCRWETICSHCAPALADNAFFCVLSAARARTQTPPPPPLPLRVAENNSSFGEKKKPCIFGSRNDEGEIITASFCDESKDSVQVSAVYIFALFSLVFDSCFC